MQCSTEDTNSAIANISAGLKYRNDEAILAAGGTFAAFQAAAIASWDGAPVGDESSPESCRTTLTRKVA